MSNLFRQCYMYWKYQKAQTLQATALHYKKILHKQPKYSFRHAWQAIRAACLAMFSGIVVYHLLNRAIIFGLCVVITDHEHQQECLATHVCLNNIVMLYHLKIAKRYDNRYVKTLPHTAAKDC